MYHIHRKGKFQYRSVLPYMLEYNRLERRLAAHRHPLLHHL
jgi:hypothetical protein